MTTLRTLAPPASMAFALLRAARQQGFLAGRLAVAGVRAETTAVANLEPQQVTQYKDEQVGVGPRSWPGCAVRLSGTFSPARLPVGEEHTRLGDLCALRLAARWWRAARLGACQPLMSISCRSWSARIHTWGGAEDCAVPEWVLFGEGGGKGKGWEKIARAQG